MGQQSSTNLQLMGARETVKGAKDPGYLLNHNGKTGGLTSSGAGQMQNQRQSPSPNDFELHLHGNPRLVAACLKYLLL